MTRLRRITVIDQAEQDLEKRIRSGEWQRRLPGFKVLAELVGVSVPTVGTAVARLVDRGVLVSQGPRRPFLVAPRLARSEAAPPPARSRYLVIVTRRPMAEMDNWVRNLVIELTRMLTREGWRCDLEELDLKSPRNLRRSLDNLRQRHPASHMLFIGGMPAISDWAVTQRGLTVGFLGGKSSHGEVRTIGVSIAVIYGHILDMLAAHGHRRIQVALWDMQPQVAQVIAGLHASRQGSTPEAQAEQGLFFNSVEADAKARKDLFLRSFRKARPTAIVVDGFFEHILVWSALLELGLRVPQDISMVNLASEDELAKLSPLPTHYKVDRKFILREIHAWIRGRPTDIVAAAKRAIESWERGETVAAAPRS